MAEMQVIGLFREGLRYNERMVGFHSSSVVYYEETKSALIIYVFISRAGIKERIEVKMSMKEFADAKQKAEDADLLIFNDN